jgi:glutaredoxin
MKIIRWFLGKIILLFDALTRPKPLQRDASAQAKVDAQTPHLALYQYLACPFCVKVRRQMRRLNLNIETRDAKGDSTAKQELVDQGGKVQVPCLRIAEPGKPVQWLYESDTINQYLTQRFA